MQQIALTSLPTLVGESLGVSDWWEIDQSLINQFADVTNDHQWIHLDTERAEKESPFKTTIAHGFLTLSLLPGMTEQTYTITGASSRINYGLNQLRFLAPVPVNSRVRGHFTLQDVDVDPKKGVKVTTDVSVEIEGNDKPALVAQSLTLLIP